MFGLGLTMKINGILLEFSLINFSSIIDGKLKLAFSTKTNIVINNIK